jgi:hypothetical protein
MNITDRYRWIALSFIIPFAVVCGYLIIGVNMGIFIRLLTDGVAAASIDDWIQIGITVCIGSLAWKYVVYKLLIDLYTSFDERGIHRPSVFQKRLIGWNEILGVRNGMFHIELKTRVGIESINMTFNRDNIRVLKYIERQIAQSRMTDIEKV